MHAQSPVTLYRSDFPCPLATSPLPDSVLYSTIPVSGNTITIGSSGTGMNWNMTPLSNPTTSYQQFISMGATPLVFQLVFLFCDYAQPLLGNAGSIGNLPLSDAYEYYNYAASDSRLEIKGFGAYITIPGQTTAIPLPALYSSPDVLYRFPLQYGNTDSSNSGYSVTLPLPAPIGDIVIKREQKRVNQVDAWGSISTPAGTFEVLRVHSTIDRMDSIITTLAPLGFPTQIHEYKWLGQTKKIPVFQVTEQVSALGTNITSVTHWGQAPNGLTHVESMNGVRIFPNPVTDQLNVQIPVEQHTEGKITITDALGKQVGVFHFSAAAEGIWRESLPLKLLPPGIYSLQICSGNKRHTESFIKADH